MKITEKHKLTVPTTAWEVMGLIFYGLMHLIIIGYVFFVWVLYFYIGGIAILAMFKHDFFDPPLQIFIFKAWAYYFPGCYIVYYLGWGHAKRFNEEWSAKKKILKGDNNDV